MQEIEVKILDIDRAKIESKLVQLGAVKSFDGEMHAIFYDFSDKAIKSAGNVLRLRKEGERVLLTFKEHVTQEGVKIMEEHESAVENMTEIQEILNSLGLHKTKETRKIRTQYDLGDTHVVIDNYLDRLEAIPVFLEIEAPTVTRLYEVVEQLGYTKESCKGWNTFDLVQYYQIV